LSAKIRLKIPIVSAIMQSVSGDSLAIALARQGGMSFIYQSQSIESQCEMIRNVKAYKAGFVRSDSNLRPDATMREAIELTRKTKHNTIVITDDGSPHGVVRGILTRKDFRESRIDLGHTVAQYMTPLANVPVMEEPVTIQEANDKIWNEKVDCVVITQGARLSSLVFRKDYYNHKKYNNELVDHRKRYVVGAGINTRDYKERAPALLKAGADALCIDSSDGHTEWQKETIRYIKENCAGLGSCGDGENGADGGSGSDGAIVGAGNVVTAEGFNYLADSGADFIKVGMGGGAICITREQKGVGRGQATALMSVTAARDEYFRKTGVYIPVCADGGIVQDYHIALAIAMGADFVMLGRYFARFDEANSEKVQIGGNYFKEYWGEGSFRAKNWNRYLDTGASGQLFEEGVDAYVPYAGKLDDNLSITIDKIKSIMINCGARDTVQFRENAVLELISGMSFVEGGAHDVVLRNS
jgi:IMP dehydrogenase